MTKLLIFCGLLLTTSSILVEALNYPCETPDALDHEECIQEQLWARSVIPHELDVPVARQLPRISVEELELPENDHFKFRRRPFILTGAMDDWSLMNKWIIDPEEPAESARLAKIFPRAVSDFYPYNMLKNGGHPYLIRFRAGLDELLHPPGRFTDSDQHSDEYTCDQVSGCRYLHLQLTPKSWKRLEKSGDIPRKRHQHTKGDEWWMRRCLVDEDVRAEYHIKTHWKIVLIGSVGAGMFNHTDSLRSASWHGHVQGDKWWYVCGRNKGPGPREGEKECFESVMKPGEILYYGPDWWHHTRNLETPTMTITGTVATKNNFEGLADRLHGECALEDLRFDFSGALCDALDGCYPLWHRIFTGKEAPPNRWKPWRSIAKPELIAKRDTTKPTQNNYDGRNYIGE